MEKAKELVGQTTKLFNFGRFKEAEALLKKTLEKDPDFFEARLEQIRSALYQDQIQEASDLIGKAAENRPNDPRLVSLEGIWFLENKQYAGAKAALSWAATQLPEDSVIRLNLAIALRNLGELPDAEKHIIKSLTINPASEFAHYEYSRILILQGRRPDALEQMVKSIECNIYFIPGFIALTNFLKNENNLDAAIMLYESAIKTAPDVDFFYAQLAILHEEKGEFEKALPYTKHLEKINNSYYDHLRVGIDTFLSGNAKEGEAIFKKCIEKSPEKWDAYYNLGEIYFSQDKLKEAKEFFQKAAERAGEIDSRPYNQLGVISIAENNDKKAEEQFLKALKANPKSFDATLNMGLVFKKRKAIPQAKEWAQKAMVIADKKLVQTKAVNDFLKNLAK